MDLYGVHARSLPQKLIMTAAQLVLIYVSYRILFGDWGSAFQRLMHCPAADPGHRVAVFVFNLVAFARMGLMMLLFLKRRIALEETISVPIAFAAY